MIETIYRNGYEFQVDFKHLSRRFKGRSAPKPPPPPAPAPRPQEINEDIKLKDQARRRQRIKAGGREGTILTQGQSLASGQATLLGRSNA